MKKQSDARAAAGRAKSTVRNVKPVIPSTASRLTPYPLDRRIYRRRNVIERLFGRLTGRTSQLDMIGTPKTTLPPSLSRRRRPVNQMRPQPNHVRICSRTVPSGVLKSRKPDSGRQLLSRDRVTSADRRCLGAVSTNTNDSAIAKNANRVIAVSGTVGPK